MARTDYTGVPEVAPEISAPEDFQHIQASPDAFGAGLARGGEALGQGISQAAKFYGTVAADNATNNFLEQRAKLLYGDPNKQVMGPDGQLVPDTGYFGMRGADAMQHRQAVAQQIDDYIAEQREHLSTPESQLQFDTESRRYRAQTLSEIGQHADQQQKVWAQNTNETTATINLNAVSRVAADDDASAALRENVRHAYAKNAQLAGFPQEGAILKADQDVALTRIRTLSVSDPEAAQRVLDKSADILGSLKDYDAISHEVKAAVINAKMAPATEDFINGVKAEAQQSTAGMVSALRANPNNLGNVKRKDLGGFEQPASPLDGVILTANNLRSPDYKGLTLAQIGAKWEGTSPQNIANWVSNVSKASGIAPGTVPNLNDPATLNKLMTGIGAAEKKPGERAAFTPDLINQGVTASLAGKHPTLGANENTAGNYTSVADYYALNEGNILDRARDKAADLFPNYPDAQERYVTNVSRHLSQTMAQQRAQYEVDVHTVTQAFASGHPPITEDQLNATSPEVAAAWNRMQIDSPIQAAAVENRFAAAAKGQAKTYGTQFNSMLQRVLAPEGDPSRIHSAAELSAYIQPGESGPLTNTGAAALESVLARRGGPGGEADTAMLRNFLTTAHHLINPIQNENLGIFYPDGEKEYQRFVGQAFRQIDAEEKAGKPLSEILSNKGGVYNSMFSGGFVRSDQKILDIQSDPDQKHVTYNPLLKHAQTVAATFKNVKTAADLQAAYQAKKITQQERDAEAVRRGWARAPVAAQAGIPPTVPFNP